MRSDSLTSSASVIAVPLPAAAAPPVDDARAAAAGIRKLPGKRLTLYTDLAGAEIDQLPAVFEQAFPQWCRYFGVNESEHADWHMTGFLMKDKARFVAAGLLPGDVPPFRGPRLSAGRHVLALTSSRATCIAASCCCTKGRTGSCTRCWAAAARRGTWRDWPNTSARTAGKTAGSRSATCREAARKSPGWGRVRTIQDPVAAAPGVQAESGHRLLRRPHIARPNPMPGVGRPSRCWTAIPAIKSVFASSSATSAQPDFNERFYRLFEPDWQELCEEWQLMVTGMEYGYDVARSAVDFTPGKPLAGRTGAEITVAADRGWQNSGLRLEAGEKYRLTAAGRYQVAKEPKIWWCEPGGVSIRYYHGRPLGILLAAVRPDHPAAGQPLGAAASDRGRPRRDPLARRNRHALPEDQRFRRRIGRQRRRVESGSAAGIGVSSDAE